VAARRRPGEDRRQVEDNQPGQRAVAVSGHEKILPSVSGQESSSTTAKLSMNTMPRRCT
jgi:hypothetical protein